MLVLTLSGTFLWLLAVSTLSRMFVYLATAAALPVLRRRRDVAPAMFRLRAGPAIAAAAIVLGVWLLSNATPREARDTAIAAAVGFAIYLKSRFASRAG